MPEFFYEDSDEQIVRVFADSWEQVNTPAQQWQCQTEYLVDWEAVYFVNFFGRNEVRTGTTSIQGPIARIYQIQATASRTDTWIEHNGTSTRVDQLSAGFGGANPVSSRIINAPRTDGQPDNCGQAGNCRTDFLVQEQVIHSIDFCPPISEEEPGCPCLCELVPLLREIHV